MSVGPCVPAAGACGRVFFVRLLLTSAGITDASIRDALVELLGKPIDESAALIVPTASHPFSSGPELAARLIRGEVKTPKRDVWIPTVESADALLRRR